MIHCATAKPVSTDRWVAAWRVSRQRLRPTPTPRCELLALVSCDTQAQWDAMARALATTYTVAVDVLPVRGRGCLVAEVP